MKPNQLKTLSNQELLELAKNSRPSPIIDALFVGFLAGIILYSVFAKTLGLVTIIPLVFIYLLLKKPQKLKAINSELKRRNLG